MSRVEAQKTQKAEEEALPAKSVPKEDKLSKKEKKKLKKEEKKSQDKGVSPNKKAALEDTRLTYVASTNILMKNSQIITLGTVLWESF